MPPFTPGITEPDAPLDTDLYFVFHAQALCVLDAGDEDAVRVPTRSELEIKRFDGPPAHYLGDLGGRACFAAALPLTATPWPHAQWLSLRGLFGRLDDTTFALAGRALQILQWDATHQFCGRCGTGTVRQKHERSRLCPQCGLTHYPRLAPAVMVLICRNNELLLARSPHFPPDMFSALAAMALP